MGRTEDLDRLQTCLARARRRLASATYGGPEWDAAMDEVEELEARIQAIAEERRGPAPATATVGHLTVVA